MATNGQLTFSDDAVTLINSLAKQPQSELERHIDAALTNLGNIYTDPNVKKTSNTFWDGSQETQRVILAIVEAAVLDVPKHIAVIRGLLGDLGAQYSVTLPPRDLMDKVDAMYFETFKNKSADEIEKLLGEEFDYALKKLDTNDHVRFMTESADFIFRDKYRYFSGDSLFKNLRKLIRGQMFQDDDDSLADSITKVRFDLVEKFMATRNRDDHIWGALLATFKQQYDWRTAATRIAVIAEKLNIPEVVEKHYAHPGFARALAGFDGSDNTTAQLLAAEKSCETNFRPWRAIDSILPNKTVELFKEALKEDGAPHRLRYFLINDASSSIRRGWIEFFLEKDDAFIKKYLDEQFAAGKAEFSDYGTLSGAFLSARNDFPQFKERIQERLPIIAREDATFANSVAFRPSSATDEKVELARSFFTNATQTVEVFNKYKNIFDSDWNQIKNLFKPNNPPLRPVESCESHEMKVSVDTGKCECKVNMILNNKHCICPTGFETREGECRPCGKNTKSVKPGVCDCIDSSMGKLASGDCQIKPSCTGLNMMMTEKGCSCKKDFEMVNGTCVAVKPAVTNSSWIASNPITSLGMLGAGALALSRLNRPSNPQLPLNAGLKVKKETAEQSGAWRWMLALVFLVVAILAVVVARYWSRLVN